jgi:hypothetical protein
MAFLLRYAHPFRATELSANGIPCRDRFSVKGKAALGHSFCKRWRKPGAGRRSWREHVSFALGVP